MISSAQLQTIFPLASKRIDSFIGPLQTAMQNTNIVTPQREAAFLAQVGHESAELLYTREISCGKALGLDLLSQPRLLEEPEGACRCAAWFWLMQHLNELADQDAFGSITHRINGGYGGLDARLKYWLRARRALAIS